MNKEQITQKQAVSIVAMFVMGSSLLLGVSSYAGQDSWIGFLIAMVAFLPVAYIYARVMHLYPGLNLFDICIEVFGKIIGKIVVVLYVWYALHLGSLVFRNFSAFVQVRVFNQMPQTVPLLFMAVLVIWVCRKGVEVLGRWALVTLPLLLFLILAVTLLLVKDLHPEFLLPVGENLADVPKDVFTNLSFPIGETVLFLGLLNTVKPGGKPGKVWLYGILIGAGTLLLNLLRNLMALGVPMHDDKFFPSYDAASLIIAGSFVSRIENVVGSNMLLGVFVKISVCLLVAAKGCAALFNSKDYRPFVAPVGLAMVALGSIVYKDIMEMYEFISVYPYYALPFELILPVLLFITAEIRHFVKVRKEKGGAPSPAPASGR